MFKVNANVNFACMLMFVKRYSAPLRFHFYRSLVLNYHNAVEWSWDEWCWFL